MDKVRIEISKLNLSLSYDDVNFLKIKRVVLSNESDDVSVELENSQGFNFLLVAESGLIECVADAVKNSRLQKYIKTDTNEYI